MRSAMSVSSRRLSNAGMGGRVARPLRIATSTPSRVSRSTAPVSAGCMPIIPVPPVPWHIVQFAW